MSIEVQKIVDESPYFSTIGEYTDKADDWAIVREGEHAGEYIANLPEDAELPERGREYRFFKPYAGGEPEGTADYQKHGLQDFERMEAAERDEWFFVGVVAKLKYEIEGHVQTLTSGGLWGIESDSGDYFKEVAEDELADLRRQAEAIGLKWPKKPDWEWTDVG